MNQRDNVTPGVLKPYQIYYHDNTKNKTLCIFRQNLIRIKYIKFHIKFFIVNISKSTNKNLPFHFERIIRYMFTVLVPLVYLPQRDTGCHYVYVHHADDLRIHSISTYTRPSSLYRVKLAFLKAHDEISF